MCPPRKVKEPSAEAKLFFRKLLRIERSIRVLQDVKEKLVHKLKSAAGCKNGCVCVCHNCVRVKTVGVQNKFTSTPLFFFWLIGATVVPNTTFLTALTLVWSAKTFQVPDETVTAHHNAHIWKDCTQRVHTLSSSPSFPWRSSSSSFPSLALWEVHPCFSVGDSSVSLLMALPRHLPCVPRGCFLLFFQPSVALPPSSPSLWVCCCLSFFFSWVVLCFFPGWYGFPHHPAELLTVLWRKERCTCIASQFLKTSYNPSKTDK